MQFATHLILTSAQSVPNITSVLDEGFRPARVAMLVSSDMHQSANWMEGVFQRRGVAVERWTIDDAWDIEAIRRRVLEFIIAHEQETIALNATGGTKPMSIAAFDVFRSFDKPVFYVHPEQDRVIWLYPENRSGFDLADKIKIPEFLQSYGVSVIEQGKASGVPLNIRNLTETLIYYFDTYTDAIGSLNYLSASADNHRLETELDYHHLNSLELMQLIQLFEQEGMLNLKGNKLSFDNEAARFFANGGWLEDYVYGVCFKIRAQTGIQDLGRSINVQRSTGNAAVPNELDVAFLKDNRLYIIECKTKKMSGSHSDGGAADILYKLDTLRDVMGGIQARSMLVSYRGLKDHDRNRAKDLNISVCCGGALTSLESRLRQWLN